MEIKNNKILRNLGWANALLKTAISICKTKLAVAPFASRGSNE